MVIAQAVSLVHPCASCNFPRIHPSPIPSTSQPHTHTHTHILSSCGVILLCSIWMGCTSGWWARVYAKMHGNETCAKVRQPLCLIVHLLNTPPLLFYLTSVFCFTTAHRASLNAECLFARMFACTCACVRVCVCVFLCCCKVGTMGAKVPSPKR